MNSKEIIESQIEILKAQQQNALTDLDHQMVMSYAYAIKDLCIAYKSMDESIGRVQTFVSNNDASNIYFNNENCDTCPSNIKNGGTGICHCILGTPIIY